MALVILPPNYNNENGLLDSYSKFLIGQFVWGKTIDIKSVWTGGDGRGGEGQNLPSKMGWVKAHLRG